MDCRKNSKNKRSDAPSSLLTPFLCNLIKYHLKKSVQLIIYKFLFIFQMETLKATDTEKGLVPTLTLLSMGIKSVPQPVLRKQFSDSATIFMELLEKYASSENGALLRGALGCLSVLLRAQEYALWSNSSTMNVFEAVLAFVLHSKPKVLFLLVDIN